MEARPNPTRQVRLEKSGIDVDRAQREGQLEVKGWDEAYLKDGYFDPDRMLSLIENAGGSLQENPFWEPPDEFLEELRQRAGPTSVN